VKVIATRGWRAITSSGFNRRRPICDQLSLRPRDRVTDVLPWDVAIDTPSFLPPLSTMIVSSPSRAEAYSAVSLSFTPKNTELVLLKSVCSWPGKHFDSCPKD
jgi:hypothetical protein